MNSKRDHQKELKQIIQCTLIYIYLNMEFVKRVGVVRWCVIIGLNTLTQTAPNEGALLKHSNLSLYASL